MRKTLLLLLVAAWLAGCSSTPRGKQASLPPPPEGKARGGYYLDDGPGDRPPPDLHAIPDAVPREEPLHRYANRPYQALGVSYTPQQEREGFSQEGIASWYGKRFHGKPTSSGEIYDMYGMTAAHPTLPIPSYAKVTALDNGKAVIVRVNDRGPFHSDRVIDLSYTAAWKLGLLGRGSGRVRVESIGPQTEAIRREPAAADVPAPAAPASSAAKEPAPGYYVQLGVFGSAANAEKLLLRARAALDLPEPLARIAVTGNLHRVRLGPFSDPSEASGWLARTRTALGFTGILIAP